MWTFSKHKEWEALANQYPEIRDMHGVPQDARHHAEGDVATHTQLVLKELTNALEYQHLAAEDQEILWTAALLHDVEKRSTTLIEADGSITSRGHARRGETTVRQLLYRNRPTPFAIREQIANLVRYHDVPFWIFDKQDFLKTLLQVSLEVNTEWLAMLARANARGRISANQTELLRRIDLFEACCRENQCWGVPRTFSSGLSRFWFFHTDTTDPNYEPADDSVCEVILMSGLPGAGKDTYINRHLADWHMISLDGYRRKLNIDPTDQEGNSYVVYLAKEEAKSLLRKQISFVWNATNLTRLTRQQLIDLFVPYGARIRLIYLEVPYQRLLHQNRNREYVVPRAAHQRMISRLEAPAIWEAHSVQYELH
ncbi:ATP-binding protein [Tellurirhabdus bombi]|uniref:ATP-binding protein n=1 Tax=Tellurirhabdus bombi TaxID=2907205 RepID=UPI001F403851|nr:ATP-binding protein [Tellurirhabdus bombi]